MYVRIKFYVIVPSFLGFKTKSKRTEEEKEGIRSLMTRMTSEMISSSMLQHTFSITKVFKVFLILIYVL